MRFSLERGNYSVFLVFFLCCVFVEGDARHDGRNIGMFLIFSIVV